MVWNESCSCSLQGVYVMHPDRFGYMQSDHRGFNGYLKRLIQVELNGFRLYQSARVDERVDRGILALHRSRHGLVLGKEPGSIIDMKVEC